MANFKYINDLNSGVIFPDMGLLRSVFSKHYMNSNKVINTDGLLSTCASGIYAQRWIALFLAFSFGFWSQFCEDRC